MTPVRRRIVAGIVIAVLLGAATTLAIAWGLAAWAPVSGNGPRASDAFDRWDRAWYITRIRHFGVRLHWWSDLSASEPARTPAQFLQDLTSRASAAELVAESRRELVELQESGRTRYPITADNETPPWGTFTGPALTPTVRIGSDTAFGWPAPCLWYQVVAGFDQMTMSTVDDELAGGILLSGRAGSRAGAFRALPLRPIWWGLALNTLLASVVWGGLLFGPVAVRRRIRRRRGRCVRCGYDLRDQVAPGCPECGAGQPQHK